MVLVHIFYNFTIPSYNLANLERTDCRQRNNISVTQEEDQAPDMAHSFPRTCLAAWGGIRMLG